MSTKAVTTGHYYLPCVSFRS